MKMSAFAIPLLLAASASAAPEVVALPGKSPLVTFRFVFRAGSAQDPAGKAGVAQLTASMLSHGGTKKRTYKEIVEAMYPMAASVESQVDKEMIAFTGSTHVDNLDAYYSLLREMLLEPGWREDDLKRLRDDQINFLRVSLRGNNDEELGKEVLYNHLYAGHPYGHHNAGRVSDLEKLTAADLQAFYAKHLTQANLTIGIAGGYPAGFAERVRKDFAALSKGPAPKLSLPAPAKIDGWQLTIVDKPTRSVAYSIGHPIEVRRGHPDFPALLVAQSYLGQHRQSWGRLFERMRQERGLNYGDYAYIEYFPNGMFQFEPDPNLARQQQIFQLWVRPVEPPTAVFALRLAMYELDKLVREGIPQEGFERTRSFLSKHVNLLMKTKSAELGYAIDSRFYGIPPYAEYLRSTLARLTREDVNRAVRKHLNTENLRIVAVSDKAAALKDKLLSADASPMSYNSPKPEEITKEDKLVERWRLPLKAENVRIVPVGTVFE